MSSAPISTASSAPVCVDARALKHMDSDELVYKVHVWAKVLCDASDSCATPGHIVIFNGTAMMMKTYCYIANCAESEMFVNSPKYRCGFVFGSNTGGLHFTAFAARYQTLAEEAIIASAVHFGF